METRVQYGSKVHPEDRAKYRLRNNPWCTLRMSIHESRHLQHSTKAHAEGRFTNSSWKDWRHSFELKWSPWQGCVSQVRLVSAIKAYYFSQGPDSGSGSSGMGYGLYLKSLVLCLPVAVLGSTPHRCLLSHPFTGCSIRRALILHEPLRLVWQSIFCTEEDWNPQSGHILAK